MVFTGDTAKKLGLASWKVTRRWPTGGLLALMADLMDELASWAEGLQAERLEAERLEGGGL
jgi:hypothetical protein